MGANQLELVHHIHSWDCPVLMKLDPESIAWTCATCGAIATAPVGAPRPHSAAA